MALAQSQVAYVVIAMGDGSRLVYDVHMATATESVPLGSTGAYNARGWPISTGKPDPEQPRTLTIEGFWTGAKFSAGTLIPTEVELLREWEAEHSRASESGV